MITVSTSTIYKLMNISINYLQILCENGFIVKLPRHFYRGISLFFRGWGGGGVKLTKKSVTKCHQKNVYLEIMHVSIYLRPCIYLNFEMEYFV